MIKRLSEQDRAVIQAAIAQGYIESKSERLRDEYFNACDTHHGPGVEGMPCIRVIPHRRWVTLDVDFITAYGWGLTETGYETVQDAVETAWRASPMRPRYLKCPDSGRRANATWILDGLELEGARRLAALFWKTWQTERLHLYAPEKGEP